MNEQPDERRADVRALNRIGDQHPSSDVDRELSLIAKRYLDTLDELAVAQDTIERQRETLRLAHEAIDSLVADAPMGVGVSIWTAPKVKAAREALSGGDSTDG